MTIATEMLSSLKECLRSHDIPFGLLGEATTRAINRALDDSLTLRRVAPSSEASLRRIAEAIAMLVREPNGRGDPKLQAHSRSFALAYSQKLSTWLGRSYPAEAMTDADALGQAMQEIWGLMRSCESQQSAGNLFTSRSAIREREGFFGRCAEIRRLKDFITSGQNVQICGERRIGKTSLIYEVSRWVSEKFGPNVLALVDLQDPVCSKLSGFLEIAASAWQWQSPPTNCVDFSLALRKATAQGRRLVLAIDETDKFLKLKSEFQNEFFEALRSAQQHAPGAGVGLSVFTSARLRLSDIFEKAGWVSPAHNTFSLMSLGPFTEDEAKGFVRLKRPGMKPFTPEELESILAFADRNPLRLQVACYHLVEERFKGRGWETAAILAAEECAELFRQ